MPEQSEVFEGIVKKHVDAGADVHTAFGRAIEEDPEAYSEYLASSSTHHIRIVSVIFGFRIGRRTPQCFNLLQAPFRFGRIRSRS